MRDRLIAVCGLLIVLGVAGVAFGPRAAEDARLAFMASCPMSTPSCYREQADASGAMAHAWVAATLGSFSLTLGLTVIPIGYLRVSPVPQARPRTWQARRWAPVVALVLIFGGLFLALATAGPGEVYCLGGSPTWTGGGTSVVICIRPYVDPLPSFSMVLAAFGGVVSGLGVWMARSVFA